MAERDPGAGVEIVKIRTSGDRLAAVPLHEIGAKGVFIKEIEEELLRGRIDIAVHSLKDLPCEQAAGLAIGAYLRREDPGDVLVSGRYASLKEVPDGSSVGTGSRRRESQLRSVRPGLSVAPLRGNVETRIGKAGDGSLDAVVIAAAGARRLGLTGMIREYLPPEFFTPAPGQGIIAAQIRSGDERAASALKPANDPVSEVCYAVERGFLRETGGGCFLPVGALCVPSGGGFALYGYIGSVDGVRAFRGKLDLSEPDPARGRELARRLLDAGGREVLLEIARAKSGDNQHP